MSSRRCIRISEAIRSELAALFQRNEAIQEAIVTITNVETSPDIKQAFVYITLLNPEKDKDYILGLLNREKAEWQGIIGRHLKTKFTPRLTFAFDSSMERGNRVLDILTEIEQESENKNAGSK